MDTTRAAARTTGLLYLGLGLAGMFGFLLIRPEIFVSDDAASTLANLIEHETLARLGVILELLVVLFQTLVAVSFYRLFRSVSGLAAGSLAAFGMINAVAVMSSAAFLVTALAVAGNPSMAPGGDGAGTVQLMYELSGAFWGVGNMFFGLWLVPMGYLVIVSRWMPRLLGWVLVGGGVGYVLSAFVVSALPGTSGTVESLLTALATVGELWMIGYLLFKGVAKGAGSPSHAPAAVTG